MEQSFCIDTRIRFQGAPPPHPLHTHMCDVMKTLCIGAAEKYKGRGRGVMRPANLAVSSSRRKCFFNVNFLF